MPAVLGLFLPTMHWVMKTSTAQGRNGIQWRQLDDQGYADDLALLNFAHSTSDAGKDQHVGALRSTRESAKS